MIKKLTLALLIALSALVANAAVGSWKIHPIFGSTPTNTVDAGDKVYYLVSKNLYCYDKETSENIAYDRSNYLNDTQITNIYYNTQKKYLLVAYDDSNIDIILNDGKVVNIPDINNALLTTAKTINDVTFADNGAYIATAFGYVIVNDEKYEVRESRIYNVNITSIAKVGNALLLGSPNGLYYGNASKQHSTLSSMSLNTEFANTMIYPLEGNAFIHYGNSFAATYSVALDESNNPTGIAKLADINSGKPALIQPVKALDKVVVSYPSAPCYYAVSADGKTSTRVNLPGDVRNEMLTSQESDGSWWTVGAKGLRKLTISGTTATVLLDYQKINASSVSIPVHLTYNEGLDILYVKNTGSNSLYTSGQSPTQLNTLSNGNWTVLSPTVSTLRNNNKYLDQTYKVVVDPNDPHSYVIGSKMEGVFRFTDNEEVAHWAWKNSPIIDSGNRCNTGDPQFDKAGNMWVIQAKSGAVNPVILPKGKFNAPETSDWITANVTLSTNWRQHFLITKKSDIKIHTSGGWGSALVFMNDNGNPAGAITKQEYNNNTTLDQDSRNFKWYYIQCLTEDLNGKIWMGSDLGVAEFDPVKCAATPNATVYRPKVPRNDGTNNADYLLDGVQVNAIAVDGMNRKWIGTDNSGLYLVSADGTEIIEQFTSANSILPSDKIISVLCNPTNNIVYVGTESGLLEYESDSSTPAATYDDVYVYPNPVRPDYTGAITIKGLMENSLVKIADSAGNVVAQMQSNGGMVTWDGCNSNGDRVKSGVYFVLASENENNESNAVVAKFLIMR